VRIYSLASLDLVKEQIQTSSIRMEFILCGLEISQLLLSMDMNQETICMELIHSICTSSTSDDGWECSQTLQVPRTGISRMRLEMEESMFHPLHQVVLPISTS
jgi:hypothetical protein